MGISIIGNNPVVVTTDGVERELMPNLPDGGGGGTDVGNYPWIGVGAELVAQEKQTYNLWFDTSYDDWEPSTTAGTILQASANDDIYYDIPIDERYKYGFYLILNEQVEIEHKENTELSCLPVIFASSCCIVVFPVFTTKSSIVNAEENSYRQANTGTNAKLLYYELQNEALSIGSSYFGPMYCELHIGTLTALNNKIGYRLAAIKARCHQSYFATSQYENIDMLNTNMAITMKLYKVPKENMYAYWPYEKENQEYIKEAIDELT